MSLTAAASGFVLFLLSLPVVQGQNDWSVDYTSTRICALKGSTVDISCTYNSYDQQIESTSWFRSGRGSEDLSKVSQFKGRVEVTDTERGRSTLRIRDLRESDSAEYHFKFKTQSFEWTSSLPGTTLTVTDVQVQVTGQRLDCVTRCNPYGSSYVWYINGEQVDGASSPSYEISYEESSDYENSYSCALKGFEDFHSPLICHNIYSCNKVTYEKRSICALKGSSVDISCTYSNFEDRLKSTSWFRSGRGSEDLSKDSQFKDRVEVIGPMIGGSTLRIRDLRESDSAEYHFKFKTESFEWKSSLPGTTLTVAALQVKVSRIISVHQSRTELTCFSSCRPAAHHSFVWFKNNERMCEQSSYQDQFNPEDIISCAFKGHENDRSAPVYAPKLPSVSVSPSAEIVEGSSVTLTCSSDANPAAKYTWYKERKLMSRGQQYIFNSIQSSDSGEYYCTAENELGERSSECISINVKYIPKLVSTSPSVPPKPPSVSVSPSAEIVEGSLVTLTCSSDANPAAKYTWYKDQKLISTEPQFIFKFIQSSDSGEYYCTAENELGERSSESISINVKYIPKLLSASPSVPQKPPSVSVSPSGEIVEGSSVTLTCSSDANPTKYTWYKEGEDSPKASGQNFTITDIRPEHSGSYYCVAQNSKGRQNSASRPINIASSRKSAAFASITVVFLAFIILSGIILIRRKRCFKANSSIERPDNRAEGNANDYYTLSAWPEHHGPSAAAQSTAAEQQDDDCYTTVHFFRKQEEPNYYNIIPTQPKRQNEDEEVEDVEYTHIRFSSTQRLRHHQTVEDSAAVYGTVNRK